MCVSTRIKRYGLEVYLRLILLVVRCRDKISYLPQGVFGGSIGSAVTELLSGMVRL